MTRSRRILVLVTFFVAWSALVGWLGARWGATHGTSGQLDRLVLAMEAPRGSPAPPRPLHVGDAPATKDSSPRLVVSDFGDRLKQDAFFASRIQTMWGSNEGNKLQVESAPIGDAGLRLTISDFDGFSGETVILDLYQGPGAELSSFVRIKDFSDNGPWSRVWQKPEGWIIASHRDWKSISKENPLFLRFHLSDSSEPFGDCVSGLVRVPN